MLPTLFNDSPLGVPSVHQNLLPKNGAPFSTIIRLIVELECSRTQAELAGGLIDRPMVREGGIESPDYHTLVGDTIAVCQLSPRNPAA
ncbi:MAG: hypothetical protein JWO18_2805 [Microbacteriaceae bacterium]|nr:hypothetical protein [Microbacteriaceae bacterium]